MVEVKRGTNTDAPFELHVEGHLVAQSAFSSVIEYLSKDDAFLNDCHRKFDSDREVPVRPFIEAKVWKDLPDEAKNILEWIESPQSGKKNIITIEIGKPPKFSASKVTVTGDGNKPIVVDKGLFETIKFYVANSKDGDDYPYLTSEAARGYMMIWNEMPEHSMSVSRRM
jgi:hypothetical protein